MLIPLLLFLSFVKDKISQCLEISVRKRHLIIRYEAYHISQSDLVFDKATAFMLNGFGICVWRSDFSSVRGSLN